MALFSTFVLKSLGQGCRLINILSSEVYANKVLMMPLDSAQNRAELLAYRILMLPFPEKKSVADDSLVLFRVTGLSRNSSCFVAGTQCQEVGFVDKKEHECRRRLEVFFGCKAACFSLWA